MCEVIFTETQNIICLLFIIQHKRTAVYLILLSKLHISQSPSQSHGTLKARNPPLRRFSVRFSCFVFWLEIYTENSWLGFIFVCFDPQLILYFYLLFI
jgi:hypothetical protein